MSKYISEARLLDLFNVAVWAPNHRHREPWRFAYLTSEQMGKLEITHAPAAAYVIVIATIGSNHFQQDENLAAAYCLIQNVKLLASDNQLIVRVAYYAGMHDRNVRQRLKLSDRERVAAILEFDCAGERPHTEQVRPPTLNWSLL